MATNAYAKLINAAVLAALVGLVGTLVTSWLEQSRANRQPFLTKQLELSFEASNAAGRLATEPDPVEWEKARRDFWRLYWGVLSIVEDPTVEAAMVKFGELVPTQPVDNKEFKKDALQVPSYCLAHTMREFLLSMWNIDLPPLENKRKPSGTSDDCWPKTAFNTVRDALAG